MAFQEGADERATVPRDPYARGVVPPQPFAAVAPVEGEFVAVMQVTIPERNLQLEHYGSRAFPEGAIAELVVTDEPEARPGVRVRQAAYLGFLRISRGGVVVVGERCVLAGQPLGPVVGFDASHEPNHYSIVVRGPLQHGAERGVQLGHRVAFLLTFGSATHAGGG